MNFKINDGLNLISISSSSIGSYLSFKRPLSVVWHDCRGSVGKYFCQLPYDESYRAELRNRINNSLYNDYSNSIEGLYEILKPLFQLFRNGKYSLNLYSSDDKDFFTYKTSSDNYSKIHYEEWRILFAEITDINNSENIKTQYEFELIEKEKNKEYVFSILECSTSGFYDGCCKYFVATQPKAEINKEQVAFFENEIKNGKRPSAIIFNCVIDDSLESANFVLDGHHKLLAYQNLKIYPSIIEIQYLPQSRDELNFDIEKLVDYLYPWQIEHILNHWYDKEHYLAEILQNPNSKIHNFIKNGLIREYHKNGQIKHEAFYINDKIDGASRGWYDNGQLEYEHFYNHGVSIGVWKNWYKSGKIQYVQPFNKKGQHNGHVISYYENGQVRWEQFVINGVNEDGVSYLSWYENGEKQAQLTYKGGKIIERKNW